MSIQYKSGYKYQLVRDCTVILPFDVPNIKADHEFIQIINKILFISRGYAWDGPSGPTIDTKNFMRGSLVHDALYQLMRDDYLDRDVYRIKADQLLKQICLEDGMSSIRANWVYAGVRLGGYSSTLPKKNEVITAP